MATTKNITMKQFNGTDYDTLYPKTVAAQIDDVYSKSETYPQSQLYTRSQLYTKEYIDTLLASRPKVQMGSYIGTGVELETITLTFDFAPKLIFFYNEAKIKPLKYGWEPALIRFSTSESAGEANACFLRVADSYEYRYYRSGDNATSFTVTFTDNSVSWNSPLSLNSSNITYFYYAFGE